MNAHPAESSTSNTLQNRCRPHLSGTSTLPSSNPPLDINYEVQQGDLQLPETQFSPIAQVPTTTPLLVSDEQG